MPATSALRSWKQGDKEFKAGLVRPCLNKNRTVDSNVQSDLEKILCLGESA